MSGNIRKMQAQSEKVSVTAHEMCVPSLTYDVDSATHKHNSKLATDNIAHYGKFF